MRYFKLIYFILLLSCQSKVDKAAYMALLQKSDLVQKMETDTFVYTLTLLPAKFMALKSENVNKSNIEKLMSTYADDVHFQLVIEDKYAERLKKESTAMYYLSNFSKEISLEKDTIMSYFHHEASHFRGKETFLMGFTNTYSSDISLSIKEHFMDRNLHFSFKKEDILTFQNLEIKI